jgi:hypothetical protein
VVARAVNQGDNEVASDSSRETSRRQGAWRAGMLALVSVVLASCGGGGGGDKESSALQIRTLSNRADLVSGGDAMVEVTAPPGLLRQDFKVTLNGTDVTSMFTQTSQGRMVALLTGLTVGNNTIEAMAGRPLPALSASTAHRARLVVTNAPRSGPVYSGSTHITPFYCATPVAQAASGDTPATLASGLSGEPDANCNIPTEYKLYYRTTAAAGTCSTALPDPNPPTVPPATSCWKPYTVGTTPADMASTTTDAGVTVPFIVRLERGTMNRGIYDLAVLFNPNQAWTAKAPQAQWNGKVWYTFGSSTGQPRRQTRPQAAWSGGEEQLKRGYMWVTNSMSDSARNSNRVMMTETVMMMKEHIGDSYGGIKFTIGTGCSGGSINANMNLSIYPGLLDGVITTCTYPDSETTSLEVGDCTLLVEAYQKPAMLNLWTGMTLTQAQINARKAAINGHMDQTACQAWYNLFGSNGRAGLYERRTVTDQVTGTLTNSGQIVNNCELPNTAVYDPRTDASRAATANLPRCNAWSWAENIWGRVPGSNQARDTRDNVGVQYGLQALLAGTISAEEFVTLNEVVGGIDRDSTPRAQRSVADVEALDIAYRSGIVASGHNLAKAPIIDLRGWDDSLIDLPPASAGMTGIHHIWFSFAIRDRIARDHGDANNQAMWRWARGNFSVPPGTLGVDAFNSMDQWLSDLVTTPGNRPIEAKVRATRPDSTRDFCILSTDATQSVRVFDMAQCDADKYLKPSLSPRQVAGGPRAEDVLKCQLKPLNAADYGAVVFTAGQWTRLQAVFSTGVCDFTKSGVGQQAAISPLTFRSGPGGVPLPPEPVSTRD